MTDTVQIDRMSYGSAGVGRLPDGKTVFVEGAAPGDVVEVALREEKPRFARGTVARVVEPSPVRVDSPCAAGCGGCPWAHLSYDAQLAAKRANVVDALVRVGHLDGERTEAVVASCVPSKREWGYRNKLELACGADAAGRLVLGMRPEGGSQVVPLDACPLANRLIERSPKALRGALRFLAGADDLGIFRVGVRGSLRTKDVEVALWTAPGPFPRAAAAKMLGSACKSTSLVRVVAEPGRARKVKKVEALAGKGCWEEELAGCRFLTSAPSFFQVNTAQAEKLVELVREGLDLSSGAYVADLYAGGGTFSVPLALAGADVVAVESAGSSVRDLRRNAERAGVDIEVVGGDAARELPELGELDALVVDPPRAGLAAGVVDSIAAAAPARVAYVSCDPQTWARDVALFEQAGYRLARATPVDLFPQTYHVEVVSIFTRDER
ncbi:23S rRNA (uracil(1939)-C(5))-methyltransferase RlmD [Adlercreutzia sp. R21]|uniref:23S rRNA (uracil(1939)-C(5))-methyltransferase RlmD n=1 Tax=Adlercreutzia wanghongyangiae TaxID=3111451 RepID=UPI002DB6EE3C|nr:23S rRNA (uracil(1939)-C(5))-methyltransferase RlmD [Adlercreutzia sp. R21]MEC4183330.1 23S rRNA (uracil(1939)-C(5))-methyltransferase RlmD [Adlercreutzia sp. R21]